MPQTAILLGAGHAHLHTLRHAATFAERGIELVCVAPEPFWYSGLATGVLGGTYPPEADQVDIARLLGPYGRFVRDRMTSVDLARRTVHLAGHPPLPYDVLSVDLGSTVPPIAGDADTYAAKPIHRLAELRADLETCLAQPDAPPIRIAVAGSGLTAVEIAANLDGLARRQRGQVAITVLGSAARFLTALPPKPAERVITSLQRRGITFCTNARVERIAGHAAELADGRPIPFDRFVNATGLRPSPALRTLGLPVDASGALLVDRHLRSVADPNVFGGGDGIAFDGHPLPKAGVFAIRQAPILSYNLLGTLGRTPLRSFRPQRRYLWIMNLGDGTGLAHWHGLTWQGRLAFLVKDRIDRRFLAGLVSR